MAKFHLALAAEFLPPFPELSFHNPDLNRAAGVFQGNLMRMQSLGRLPTLLAGGATVWQTFEMLARKELMIPCELPLIPKSEVPLDIHLSKELLRAHLNMQWFESGRNREIVRGMEIGESVLSKMVPAGGAETAEGIEAVLIGMLTGTWTAFEVLTEDVWVAAVKAIPILETQISKAELKISGKRSLPKARNLYGFTFRYDNADIINCLSDHSLDALSLTRNLIVHTGGKIDKPFDDRRKTIAPLSCFSHVQLDHYIPIEGQIVRDLIQPISTIGLALAKGVDEWIYLHRWPASCLI